MTKQQTSKRIMSFGFRPIARSISTRTDVSVVSSAVSQSSSAMPGDQPKAGVSYSTTQPRWQLFKKEVRPAPARLPGAPRATPQLPRSVARPCILLATERPLRHHLTAGESKILSEAESLSSPNLNVPVPRPCQWPPASEAHPARCHCSGSGTASEPGPATSSGSGASRRAEGVQQPDRDRLH